MAGSARIDEASGGDEKPMSEINTTPLVDVMLVLLIIFLITIPVITQSVKVELPKAVMISASPTGPATLSMLAWPLMPTAVSAW